MVSGPYKYSPDMCGLLSKTPEPVGEKQKLKQARGREWGWPGQNIPGEWPWNSAQGSRHSLQ